MSDYGASVGELSSADWWWQHGLDGLVGGLVGALVTVVAVFLTLRHERTLRSDERLTDRLTELIGICSQLSYPSVPPESLTADQVRPEVHRIRRLVYLLQATVRQEHPHFATVIGTQANEVENHLSLLEQARDRKGREIESARIVEASGDLVQVIFAFQRKPALFRRQVTAQQVLDQR